MRALLLLLIFSLETAGANAQPHKRMLKDWSSSLREVARPALVWCWATACALTTGAADAELTSRVSLGTAFTDYDFSQIFVSKRGFIDDGGFSDDTWHGFIDGAVAFDYIQSSDGVFAVGGRLHGKFVVSDAYQHVSALRLRPFSFNAPINWLDVSLIGYDYLDLRSYQHGGFTARQVHLLGLETPFLGISVGIGDTTDPVLRTASEDTAAEFQHEALEAWAGAGASITHGVFVDTYVNLSSAYFDTIAFLLQPVIVSIGAEQARADDGAIALPDGSDGEFTAIWERLFGKVELPLYEGEQNSLHLGVELSFCRQRLDAEIEGAILNAARTCTGLIHLKQQYPDIKLTGSRSFSQRSDGKQILLLLTLTND